MDRAVYEFVSKQTNDPIIEWRNCQLTGKEFPIFQGDVDMLEKLSPTIAGKTYPLPVSAISPQAWELLNLMYVNQRHLYHHTCALTGEKIVSRIAPEVGVPVYSIQAWASDERDYSDYGLARKGGNVMEYIQQLSQSTPYQNLIGSYSNVENNAVYTNYTSDLFNCYLVVDSNTTDHACYCVNSRKSSYVVDCLNIISCESCWQCVDCSGLYQSTWCYDSVDLTDCHQCIDCHGCDHCIGCTNLVNTSYHVYNQPVSPEVFNQKLEQLRENDFVLVDKEREQIQQSMIKKPLHMLNVENSIGENIRFSKDVFLSRNVVHSEGLRYCSAMGYAQDCMHVAAYGQESSRMYGSSQVGRYSQYIYFSKTVGRGEHLYYCIDTKKSKHCFGCVNLKQKEYCIFNKQYTKQQYEELVPQLIEQMQKDGQWGLPHMLDCSVVPYNDSLAMEHYPVRSIIVDGQEKIINEDGEGSVIIEHPDKFISEATLDLGGAWKLPIKWRTTAREINMPEGIEMVDANEVDTFENHPHPSPLPTASLGEGGCTNVGWNIDPAILDKAIICEVSGKPFRVIEMELDFYRKRGLSLSRRHPDIRHQERMNRRPGRELYLRTCDYTGKEMVSFYPPDSPFKVYSEESYKKVIYG